MSNKNLKTSENVLGYQKTKCINNVKMLATNNTKFFTMMHVLATSKITTSSFIAEKSCNTLLIADFKSKVHMVISKMIPCA